MKKFLAIVLVLLMALSLVACGKSEKAQTATATGSAAADGKTTLIIGMQDEIESTDLHTIGWENVVHSLIYSPLVTFNEDLSELVPCFAESFEISEDGMSISFTLPENCKFSNGRDCTSADIKASVERFLEVSEYAGDLESLQEVEVVDDRNFIYHLSEPAPYMYPSIASTYGGMLDVQAVEEMGDDAFGRCAVGNGLFYVEDWQAGNQIILKKNPYYQCSVPSLTNKGAAQFDEIIVRFIPDEFTRVSELEAGNVDMIFDVPSASIADFEANEDINVYSYNQAGVNYMMFNTDDEILSDVNIRKAINVGIDRDALALALDGNVTPAYGVLSPAQACYSAEEEAKLAKEFAYNPDEAKKLLAASGWTDTDGDGFVDKNGQKLTITYYAATDKTTSKTSAPVIQEQLKNIGVDLEINEYEAAYIKQLQRESSFQITSRTYEWNDADILIYVFTTYSGYPFDDPALTAILEEARTITDTNARTAKYAEFQEALKEIRPAVALFSDRMVIAANKNVEGLVVTNDGRDFFNDVTIK